MTRRILGGVLTLLLLTAPVLAQSPSVTGSLGAQDQSATLTNVSGYGGAGFQVSGTWSGTITFECSVDRTTFVALNAAPYNSSTSVTTTSGNGAFQSTITGCTMVRARMSAYTSGTASVTIQTTANAIAPAAISVSSSGNAAAGATGGAVPASADYTGVNIGGNLTGATGFSVGTARAVATAIIDGSGNQITSFGGGTQYTNAAAQATPTGTVALGWDGTNVRALSTNGSGVLSVNGSSGTFPSTQSGTWTVQPGNTANTTAWLFAGGKTHNNAAPGATNIGVLPALANASAPTFTEGDQVLLSVDLSGNLRTSGGAGGTQYTNGSAQATPTGTVSLGYDGANVRAIATASNGHVQTDCSNCSGSGASATDESAFVQGTNSVAPAGLLFKTSYTALTTGQVGVLRGFSDGSLYAMGSVASGATDSGNPLKVGGVYNSSPITLTTGQRGDVQLDANGYTKVNIAAGGSTTVTEAATITANQSNEALTAAVLYGFDGSTDSRIRTRAGTINSADVGVVTRPFLASDGTNTQPAMDAAARAGFQKFTDGTNTAQIDPCEANAQTSTPISMTTATTLRIVAPTSAKKTYVCGLTLLAGAADNVALVEGTGGSCVTGITGVAGGTTAANGFNLAANGGFVWPAGKVAHAVTAGTNVDLCLITSSTGPLTGVVKWVQQ
jgi:hypothetical protein